MEASETEAVACCRFASVSRTLRAVFSSRSNTPMAPFPCLIPTTKSFALLTVVVAASRVPVNFGKFFYGSADIVEETGASLQ